MGGGLKNTTTTGNPITNNGTWNTTEILCFLSKGFCRVALNGTAALTYQEVNLKSIMAGPIGLQIHDGTNEEVQYRDVPSIQHQRSTRSSPSNDVILAHVALPQGAYRG